VGVDEQRGLALDLLELAGKSLDGGLADGRDSARQDDDEYADKSHHAVVPGFDAS
jgi:hypothetical protein